MNIRRMKEIAEAYDRILRIKEDISSIDALAEKILDSNSTVWVSMDTEEELIMSIPEHPVSHPTTTYVDDGVLLPVPDTVALEIIGVIMRHKQQLLDNESNNI